MATRSVGTKLRIASNFIAGLRSIAGLELSADTIDTTTLDSDGGYREFIGGFKDGGEVGISGFFKPGDAGQAAVYAEFESGATLPFEIIFPPSLGASWTFNGVVTNFSTGAELEDAIAFEATIKVSGKPTLGLAPSGGLTALSLSGTGGTLSPSFANSNYKYAFSGVSATSVTVTATAADHTLRLYVDGVFSQNLTSGVASSAIPVVLNKGVDIMIVAQEEAKTPKIYEIVAIKTS